MNNNKAGHGRASTVLSAADGWVRSVLVGALSPLPKSALVLVALGLMSIAAMVTAESAAAATTYAKAQKIGKAHGPGCGNNGFSDITGKCWTCPTGYSHHNILIPPTNAKACKKPGTRTNRKGTEVGKSVLGICKKGWVSLNNGRCYTCPSGYKHDVSKFGTVSGVCYKPSSDRYAKATASGGSLVCSKGFFSPQQGGTCWTCPSNAPTRTPLTPVTAANACQSAACGGAGERPCQITERILPCESGLFPDYFHNQCVKVSLQAEACKATVAALKAGKSVAGFANMIAASKSRTEEKREQVKSGSNRDALMSSITTQIERYKAMVPELNRVMALMKSKKSQLEALFDSDSFCILSNAEQEKRIAALGLKPGFMTQASLPDGGFFFRSAHAGSDDHFYMGYQVGVSGSVGLGLDISLIFVTDFRGNGGKFIAVGPQLVSNVAVDASPIGLQFFPKVNLDDFKGWGWGIGISGGPPSKIVSAGIDVSYDETFKVFQGFGLNGAIGVGVIPGDIGVSATHAWQMK